MEVGQTVIITKTGEYGVVNSIAYIPYSVDGNVKKLYLVEISGKNMFFPESSLSTKEQKVLNILRQWKSSK